MQKRTQVVKYGDYGTNGWQKWYLAKSNFDELCNLRDNISYARFRTELDEKLGYCQELCANNTKAYTDSHRHRLS